MEDDALRMDDGELGGGEDFDLLDAALPFEIVRGGDSGRTGKSMVGLGVELGWPTVCQPVGRTGW